MPNYRFKAIPPRAPLPKSGRETLVLQQDNWNDYGFQTQYQLYRIRPNDSGPRDETLIGSVKILKRGQVSADRWQITEDFDNLSPEFCSVGDSLDYYERLNKIDEKTRLEILAALNDVVSNSSLVDRFSSEDGWGTSLFRDQKDHGAAFRLQASSLLTGSYTSLPDEGLTFSFLIPGWEKPARFEFGDPKAPFDLLFEHRDPRLPERISVLVGANGSGKSTLLARLARVAFGTTTERQQERLATLGTMEPQGLGFPRIISIAFSPFDSFQLPGSDARNRKQLAKDISNGVGRFVFIGLRDIAAEYSMEAVDPAASSEQQYSWPDKNARTCLKPIEQLASEFISSLERILEKDRERQFWKACETLLRNSGLSEFDDYRGSQEEMLKAAKEIFLGLSTGHKIVLLMASGLIANIERNSLVLVDEPETHLHPPLLAALMHVLRSILRRHSAFAIVATHSPVVLQESLARHVLVIRREGEITTLSPVSTETFGESIGLITSEVFKLQAEATDYHKVLDRLIDDFKEIDAIESLFLDGMMSHQARGYVLSRIGSRARRAK